MIGVRDSETTRETCCRSSCSAQDVESRICSSRIEEQASTTRGEQLDS